MVTANLSDFFRRLTRGMAAETLAHDSDQQLVARALAERDEAPFQAIVHRHGPMVYRVCWRALQHSHDAEDAFQATFLILAQKLRTVRNQPSLASWLHGVAHRVALKAKAQSAARRRREQHASLPEAVPPDEVTWGELRLALDCELGRLPDKWRLPLILCYLEGRTQDESASQLGWSKSTLRRRLEEAQDALGGRLKKRGVVWSAALSAVLISACLATAAPTPALVALTVEAAVGVAVGKTVAASASANVAALTEGVLKTMFLTKLKTAMTVLFLGFAAVGFGGFAYTSIATEQAEAQPEKKKSPPANVEEKQPLSDLELAKAKLLQANAALEAAKKNALAAQESYEAAIKKAQPADAAEVKNFAQSILRDALKEMETAKGGIPNRVLADIAVIQARMGDRVASTKTFELARKNVRDDDYWEFRTLAPAHGQAGDAEGALKLARAIPDHVDNYRGKDKEFRAGVFRDSAVALATAGHLKQALRVVEVIDEPEAKKEARERVLSANVRALAKAGKFREALQAVETLPDAHSKLEALVGEMIHYFFMEYPHRDGIALIQLNAGDKAGARKTTDQALAIVRNLPKDDWLLTWPTVACVQARLGDIPAAWASLQEIRGEFGQGVATAAIVQAQARAGKIKEARELMQKVATPLYRLDALCHLAMGQAEAGDRAGARATFQDLITQMEGLPQKERDHWHEIASAQAEAGDFEGALKTTARRKFESNQTFTLSGVAYYQALAGDFPGALKTADRMTGDSWWKGNTLRSIAEIQAKRGDAKGPLAWARKLDSAYDRANALLGVAEGLAGRVGTPD